MNDKGNNNNNNEGIHVNETEDFDLLEEQRRILEENPIQDVNGIIAGMTGAGKSTLINQFFGFKAEVAPTGSGKPCTKDITFYRRPGSHFTLYDTRGLEVGNYEQTYTEILEKIKSANKIFIARNHIHFMWYCINSESKKFQEGEINFIRKAQKEGVLIIFVITQCYSPCDELSDYIKNQCPGIPVVPIMCKEASIKVAGKTIILPPFGLPDLLQATMTITSYAIYNAMARTSIMFLQDRYIRAESIIQRYVSKANNECHRNLPFMSIDKELGEIVLRLMMELTSSFDLSMDENFFLEVINNCSQDVTHKFRGRLIAASFIKIGTFFGAGLIGCTILNSPLKKIEHGVASKVTKAIGYAYLNALFTACNESNELEIMVKSERIGELFRLNVNSVSNSDYQCPTPITWEGKPTKP